MTPRKLTFISIFFIFNSLNAMEDTALKQITNKTKPKKSTKKSNSTNSPYSITKELFFTQKIQKNDTLPQDIAKHILEYCALLKDKDFENSTEPFIKEWRDFRIPTFYSYLLTQKQIKLIQALFTSHPKKGNTPQGHREISYILPSDKKYKLFLTLPIELRRCLTLLPETELTLQKEMYSGSKRIINYAINPTSTIEVKCLLTPNDAHFIGSKSKLIVPEEKTG